MQIIQRRAAPAGSTDPYRAQRSLILHFDGSSIVDTSPRPKTITVRSGVALTTSFSKFGGSSVGFAGSTTAYLSTGSHSDFAFGTGNFTVEAWLRQTTDAQYSTFIEIGNHINNTGIAFLAGNNTSVGTYGAYSGGFYAGDGVARTFNSLQHVAWVRSSNSLLIYKNTALIATRTFTNNLTDTSLIGIGYAPTGGGSLANYIYTGQMDELIVTKGVALSPSEFAYTSAVPDV